MVKALTLVFFQVGRAAFAIENLSPKGLLIVLKTSGRVMEFPKFLLAHPLTWCLLIMSFNFPSSLGSISGHRKMLGRDRQLFCGKKK